MSTPRHPRREALAEAAYKALVTNPAARSRTHATRWHNLGHYEREDWCKKADEWAYVVAVDAREELARRQGTAPVKTEVEWAAQREPTPRTSGIFQTAGLPQPAFMRDYDPMDAAVDRFVDDYQRRRGGHFAVAHYTIHPDGTVTKTNVKPGDDLPTLPLELEQGRPTDTRRTTHHAFDLDPGATGILRRSLYPFALTTYPLACHGLPAGETRCTCPAPTPIRHYGADSPLHPEHQPPPGDAWLRCTVCRGLYTRTATATPTGRTHP